MKNFGSVDETLDFAIEREEIAAEFYTDLADKVEYPWMRKMLLEFAGEEQGHKKKLLGVKQGKRLISSSQNIMDLKIADYLVDVEPGDKVSYKDALIIAMKREKASFKLYTDLAEAAEDEGLKETFRALAQEEAKHKLRFELEYDKEVLSEN